MTKKQLLGDHYSNTHQLQLIYVYSDTYAHHLQIILQQKSLEQLELDKSIDSVSLIFFPDMSHS